LKSDAPDVAAYLAAQPDDPRAALSTLRDLIRSAAPEAAEGMRNGLPTWDLNGPLFALASQKQYMALYVCEAPDLVDARRADFAGLSVGKGCVRFTRIDKLPLDVVRGLLAEAAARRA
jgi:uncharacterized protein YdhG (YjbR/CyaY superfamily)